MHPLVLVPPEKVKGWIAPVAVLQAPVARREGNIEALAYAEHLALKDYVAQTGIDGALLTQRQPVFI
jgi:hypothetical protein